MRHKNHGLMVLAATVLAASPVCAQTAGTALQVDADGTVHADGVVIPPSAYLSPAARAALTARLVAPPAPMVTGSDFVNNARASSDVLAKGLIAKWMAIYPARIAPVIMNGVQTDVVVPIAGIARENRHRVLINLHGGGFFTGARSGGQAEAVPLAGRGRIEVVAVDYRLAPENRFPAASQDVERVYRALLKGHRPGEIGIYGCSAGGALVAQAVAWFQRHHLPAPGAIGIFCSGAMPGFWYGGDSFATTPMMNARAQPAPADLSKGAGHLYLAGTSDADPLVTPGLFPQVLAKFPPTLIVTGTRDTSLSNALVTNARLLDAGVETELFVQEGLGHGDFNLIPGAPEAAQAYTVIWRFFDRHLAK